MNTAVIIDTLSIQSYIFRSNKLKENIGGSYIIEHLVYKKIIPLALKESGQTSTVDLNAWSNSDPEEYKLKSDDSLKVEIGYIGGGNALLIFREEADAKRFLRIYSRLLLQYFPGLNMAYGMQPFNYEEGKAYGSFRRNLNDKLKENRNQCPRLVLPYKHGIVEDCAWSNEAQEVWDTASKTWISQLSNSRISYVQASQEKLKELLPEAKRDQYKFTAELEDLGQPDDKGYVAIVHADGNGMGKRFLSCTSLAKTRQLSKAVADLADTVMKKLMAYLINLIEGEDTLIGFELLEEGKETVLPIRPLIAGGDDITFVCEGRLGIHLAEKLLKLMTETLVDGEKISACAGVSIVHTKYPFYKAYQLAEESIKKAKDASRDDDSSWISYMISTGGFSGSYDDVIDQQYTVPFENEEQRENPDEKGRVLKQAPYRVDGKGNAIQQLKAGMKQLLAEEGSGGWPRNKIKELGDVLRRDKAFQDYFLEEIKARKLDLPGKMDTLWNGNQTPFFDMVELLDFYPQELLNHEI